MHTRRLAGALLALAFAMFCGWTGGCSGTASTTSGGTTSNHNGQGYCAAAFNKACSTDNDCQTSSGERCCPYGSLGSICQQAASCPISCTTDQPCNTSAGEACSVTSLETGASKSCEQPAYALKLCQADTDCTGGDVCCQIYNQGICEPSNSCPKTCQSSGDCPSTAPVCCTTVRSLEPALASDVTGLCLNPSTDAGFSTGTPCPKACTTSADCANQGQLCCQGICSDACPKSCTTDGDCQGVNAGGVATPLCSFTYNIHAPPAPTVFELGPTCQGTPSYGDCSSCTADNCFCAGCSTPGTCTGTAPTCAYCGTYYSCNSTYCPGCSMGDAGSGSCSGTAGVYATCDSCPSTYCGSSTYPSYCPGCTLSAGSCTGTTSALYSTCDSCPYAECGADEYCPGCTPDSSTSTCTGTVTPCSGFTTSTDCTTKGYSCSWSGTCSGTITPCSAYTNSTDCSTNGYACYWSSTTVPCTGTANSCSSFTSQSTCPISCVWSSTGGTCSGTITPCSALATAADCSTQPGCFWQ